MRVFAEAEALWVLFIVATIIARVIKAARDKKPGKDASPSPNRDYKASDAELKEFLGSLTGKKPAPPTPQVSPTPRVGGQIAPATPKRQTRQRQVQARRRRKPKPSQPAVPVVYPQDPLKADAPPVAPVIPPPPPPVEPAQTAVAPSSGKACVEMKRVSLVGREIFEDLANTNATRKAILLREILGPPVAMRRRA